MTNGSEPAVLKKHKNKHDPSKGNRKKKKTLRKGGEIVNESAQNTNFMLLICICIAITATFVATMFAVLIVSISYISAVSRAQYNALREMGNSLETAAPDVNKSDAPDASKFDEEMHKINSDYICWIKIEGTAIDYPVVQTNDNEKYLNLSFNGEKNMLGTLFMDFRCTGNYVPHIIIYGHNSRHGDMFGGLRHFLDERYMNEHPTISLKVNDQVSQYDIFSARKTNVNDSAYYLDFEVPGSFALFAERCGAPSDATQILTLSTCVSGDDEDERIIIQGVLRN